MRGVYNLHHAPAPEHHGSSPHARGLQTAVRPPGPPPRIIPACAGFTIPQDDVASCATDHPRMRGVYGCLQYAPTCHAGSSPHARGLLTVETQPGQLPRIIPACAGFTRVILITEDESQDHPRMRGVYFTQFTAAEKPPGSSPHARGLPHYLVTQRRSTRIIPACAGFTSHRDQRHDDLTDHPRMRGVYGAPSVSHPVGCGSSPHARGLPPAPGYHLCIPRIIPACAGFTSHPGPPPTARWDHPRMRGVYPPRHCQ